MRWRRTVPNPLEKEPQGRGILFVPFNVSIPSIVFIFYLVRVGLEIRKNENELDVNTQVVFDYSFWRLWIMQSLFKEQTICSNWYNWKTGTDAPNLNNSLRNLVKEAFLWRKRLIRRLFPLPNVPWNREKWFLLILIRTNILVRKMHKHVIKRSTRVT